VGGEMTSVYADPHAAPPYTSASPLTTRHRTRPTQG
jgi:hypothetical protein